jgi:hypothetical protein
MDGCGGKWPSPPPGLEADARQIRFTPRDALPLPHLRATASGAGVSRGTQRRRGHAAALIADCNRCVDALNDMYAEAADPGVMCDPVRVSDTQVKCMDRILFSCRSAGRPPADLTPAEALRELRLAGPYQEDAPLGPVAFDPDLVSLPPAGSEPVPLEKLWGSEGAQFLERLDSCLVPNSQALERLQSAPAVAFSDQAFNNERVWEDFVASGGGWACGLRGRGHGADRRFHGTEEGRSAAYGA